MITIEYPCYYTKFKCIAGNCPNTCCRGWEVDVDEDSASFYRIYPGAFGDRLRQTLCTENGAFRFPQKADGRCPFLDEKGLCEIYSNIGEGALCVTCDEYPRYFAQFPGYEIRDLSISCPEAARILFTETPELYYDREQEDDSEDDLTEDIFDDEEEDSEQDESIESEEETDPEEAKAQRELLEQLLSKRNQLLASWQKMDLTEFNESCLKGCEEDESLIAAAASMEAVNAEWTEVVSRIKRDLERIRKINLFKLTNSEEIHEWFVKLAMYFTYRYLTDEMYGEKTENETNLFYRSLRMIYLMCCERVLERGELCAADMIELSGLYSRQVEHSEASLDTMKGIEQ